MTERAERTLVAWCPDWPVVAAGVPLDQPAIVVHANRVVACSPAAREEGVVEGLRRREAQGRCPQAELLAHDPARDARAFEPAVASLDVLCPRVEITRPGSCALATRGPSRYHGGDEALAEKVGAVLAGVLKDGPGAQHQARPSESVVRVGIADGMLAATAAARKARPDAPVVVPPGASGPFLAPWPVTVLVEAAIAEVAGLPDDRISEIADVLRQLGLRTFGALAEVPAADVLARFGREGAALHRLARGLDARPLAARHPAPDLAATVELDPPVERVDTAAFVAVGLADELHRTLGSRGLACTRVAVVAETEHGESLERCWRHEGTLGAAAVAERVRWQLDGWLSGSAATRPTAGITQLTLRPEEVVAARGRQLGFWGGETLLDERAGRALARVAGLLGAEAVRVPELRGGRGPGEQLTMVPSMAVDLVESRPAARPGWVTEPWPGRLPAPAPALVHAEPVTVELLDAAGGPVGVSGRGDITAGPDLLVTVAGSQRIAAWAGPWPADERWWDPDGHRRRARLQVVTGDGAAHLLALEGGRWHIEATYD
ncbi:MAG: DNA polymerase Y family protein [Acidimicrobiia bacterium]|nr:DNA polymerase Y family protein [Acidimicrobiia bacterium]